MAITLSSIASAQQLGDMNCNGWAWEIGDIVLVARFIVEACDMYPPPCPENSDFDGDGRSLTAGDIIYYMYLGQDPPEYPRHPASDTFMVESAIARPGETSILPVWISTVDTIMGFQFLLETDPDYLTFDSLIADSNIQLNYCSLDGDIYCISHPNVYPLPIFQEPGNYHICDLVLTVNPDINEPITTPVLFSSISPRAMYSGFANSDFFLPVMIGSEIQIIPVTAAESENEAVPAEFRITAYPNPFNSSLDISVYSERAGAISVYDIIGRPVRTFGVDPGNNLIRWNVTDINGRSLSAGIYFIGDTESGKFEKVMYLK